MKIEVSEEKGELSWSVFWISLDGRLQTEWFRTKKEAMEQYDHIKNLKGRPSLNVRIK